MFNTEESIKIFIFSGSNSDLSRLDLSFFNLRFLKIDSDEFIDFVSNTNHETFEHHNKRLFEKYWGKEFNNNHLYALIPIDLDGKMDAEDVWLVRAALLVMFPSDISIHVEIRYQFFDSKYLRWNRSTEWPIVSSGYGYYDNFLTFDEKNIGEINSYLKTFLIRCKSLKYLKTTVSSYSSSFLQQFPRMAYLDLCISLESIIDGTNELVYRIRRNVAIICGETRSDCKIIFNNINKIYRLRSKIVHGEDYDTELIEKYLPYLILLISRSITELISLNVPSKTELNEILTEVGFGENKKNIFAGYDQYDLNPSVKEILFKSIE